MKRSLLCAALLLGSFIALDDAAAIEIAIDDTTIELVAPKGYCPLDRRDWPEAQLVDFASVGFKRQGERLAYFADCERVRSWHEGGSSKDAGDIVDYQASLEFRDQNVSSAMLEDFCATLRKGDDSNKGWFDIFLKAMKGAVAGKYGGAEDTTLTYVVLGYEDAACYVFRASIMKNREQVHMVSALTAIKGKLVTVHLPRKVGNMDFLKGSADEVMERMLATSREAASALIAANQ